MPTELQGKLLIAAGTGDDNVHFANTLEVLDELIAAGKYAEVAVFPGRGHGISDPKPAPYFSKGSPTSSRRI